MFYLSHHNLFETEYTKSSWLLVLIAQAILLIILTIFIYILTNVYQPSETNNIQEKGVNAARDAVNIVLRGVINKGTNISFKKSQAFKILIFSLMVLGFILLSYYRAQMNAALNVEVDNMPIKSWKDVQNSNYKVLIWLGTISEEKFKNAPKESALNNIYVDKILTVPEETHISQLGYQKSVPLIMNGDYLAFEGLMSFTSMEEYPCGITDIKEFR